MHRTVRVGLICGVLLVVAGSAIGQETERRYLSGRGKDDAVDWEFFCTAGRRSGDWATIAVPSNWELQGFGTYNYGHDADKADEQGRYRHSFSTTTPFRLSKCNNV